MGIEQRRRIERRRDMRQAADAVEPDIRDEEWYPFVSDIDDMVSQQRYQWAEGILRKIRDTIEQTHWVTDAQIQAVVTIQRAERPLHDWARKWPWPID